MKRIRREYVIIAVFWLLIGTAYFWWGVFGGAGDQTNHEKRDLAEWPEFSIETISDYPGAVEDYINDHLPFRDQLIQLNSAMEYYLFHSSTSDSVLVGKDNWLFYADTDDGDPISNIKGRNLLTDEQLAAIEYNMVITRDHLAEQGIEFVIFIAPNKARVYSGQLPVGYGSPASEYPVQQIVNFLRDNTDIRIVYPVNEIVSAANMLGADTLVYHKTDTHWNPLGAYIGTRELLSALHVELPSYDAPEITLTHVEDGPGDLADLLHLSGWIDAGEYVTVSGYDTHNYVTLENDLYTTYRYTAENADPRKIMVCRDSFADNMANVIGSQFAESVMIHQNYFTYDMIAAEQPDIFVLEMVERYAPKRMTKFLYE